MMANVSDISNGDRNFILSATFKHGFMCCMKILHG